MRNRSLKVLLALGLFFVTLPASAADTPDPADIKAFVKFWEVKNPVPAWDKAMPYEASREAWTHHNPRLYGSSGDSARFFREEFLISLLQTFDPDGGSKDHCKAAWLAADCLGRVESETARTALVKALVKIPDTSYVKFRIINALAFRPDLDKAAADALTKIVSTTETADVQIAGVQALILLSIYSPKASQEIVGFFERVAAEGSLGTAWRYGAADALVKAGEEARAMRCAMIMLGNADVGVRRKGGDIVAHLGYLNGMEKLKEAVTGKTDLLALRTTLKNIKRDERGIVASWRVPVREALARKHGQTLRLALYAYQKEASKALEAKMLIYVDELRRIRADREQRPILPELAQSKDLPVSVRDAVKAAQKAIAERESKLDRVRILGILKQAAGICRSQPPALAKPGESADRSQYLDVIKPLLKPGPAALPILKELIASEKLDRFEKRLAEILARRIEHPKQFEKLAAYFIPDASNPMADLLPKPNPASSRHRARAILVKRIELELMHSSVRDAAAKNGKAFAEIKKALAEMRDTAQSKPGAGILVHQQLRQNFAKRMIAAKETYRVSSSDLRKLKRAVVPGGPLPPLDDLYLMAWEEAMVRPVPWQMKRYFARIVLEFNSDASLSSLCQVLRQAFEEGGKETASRSMRSPCRSFGFSVLRSLVDRQPNELLVRQLCAAVRLTDGKGQEVLQRILGGSINARKPWRDFLLKLELNEDFKADVEYLREGGKLYRQAEDAARAKIEW
jgi:HEAT repeat protein